MDDLLVVRDIFSGGDGEGEPVQMGKYSKRILASLALVVIASFGSFKSHIICTLIISRYLRKRNKKFTEKFCNNRPSIGC